MIAPVMLVALYCIEFSTSKSMMSMSTELLSPPYRQFIMTPWQSVILSSQKGLGECMYKVADADTYKKNVKENG